MNNFRKPVTTFALTNQGLYMLMLATHFPTNTVNGFENRFQEMENDYKEGHVDKQTFEGIKLELRIINN